MLWFIIGAFVGSWFGFALAAVLCMAKESREVDEANTRLILFMKKYNGCIVRKWISVRDYLPDEEDLLKNSEFLVVIEGAANATTLLYDGEGWVDDMGDCYPVTHWMPLPEIPEEVK